MTSVERGLSILATLRQPQEPQRCLACGDMVQTYAEYFTDDCDKATETGCLGHDVDYLLLPMEAKDATATHS